MQEPVQIELPEKLDTGFAGALRDLLVAAPAAGARLDGGKVRMVGALCAQVLAAARAAAGAGGAPVACDMSDQMAEDLRLLGLGDLFQSSERTA